jgi:hypothetical protein
MGQPESWQAGSSSSLGLTLCGLCAVGSIVFFSFKEGIAKDNVLFYLGMAAALIYYLLIFSYVAIKGKAPPGWLPWAK